MAAKHGAPGHNAEPVSANRLRSFILRIEHLNEEIKGLSNDKSEVFKEARGEGFDVKTMKLQIQRRAQSRDERDEQDTLLELYEAAFEQAEEEALSRARASGGFEVMSSKAPASEAPAGGSEGAAGDNIGDDAALQMASGEGHCIPTADDVRPHRGRDGGAANTSGTSGIIANPPNSPPNTDDDTSFLED